MQTQAVFTNFRPFLLHQTQNFFLDSNTTENSCKFFFKKHLVVYGVQQFSYSCEYFSWIQNNVLIQIIC